MIIWLNGAFGSGKTTIAFELQRRLPGAFVFDPENAGYYLRKNLPQTIWQADFQDDPLWRQINLAMLRRLSQTGQTIIVPMTLVNPQYYDEIIGSLRAEGIEIRVILLMASKKTLVRRLHNRLEGRNSWARQQIDRCQSAFLQSNPAEKLWTDRLSIEATVEAAAHRAGIRLIPERRSTWQQRADRLKTMIRHIR